jgi:hypothetical protein
MSTKPHIAIVAVAAIALSWGAYAWVKHRYANAAVEPEVFAARLENLRSIQRMDSRRRESLLVSLARLFRRVPGERREELLADARFKRFYHKELTRDDRLTFIAYTFSEPVRAEFERFIEQTPEERVRLVRRWFKALRRNEIVRETWSPALLDALDNDMVARMIAENVDTLFAAPTPTGRTARMLLYPMMREAHNP